MKAISLHAKSIAAILALSLASSLQGADQPQPSKIQRLLKPFQSASKPVDAKTAQLLSGPWKGTFTHKNQDGTMGETTYLIEVAQGLDAMRVSIVQPKPKPGMAQSAAPVPSRGLGFYLQPTLKGSQSAVWDGRQLQVTVYEKNEEDNATIAVEKQMALSMGQDSKHALFAYDIQVKSVSGPRTNTTKLHAAGVLSRPH